MTIPFSRDGASCKHGAGQIFRLKVHRATKELLQRFFEIQEIREACGDRRFELDEHVHIAMLGVEVLAQNRPKDLEALYAMLTT